MSHNQAFAKRVAAATGAGVESAVLTFAAVAGFAVPWLAFEWLSSWQSRRWQAEWLARMQRDLHELHTESSAEPEPRRGRRFRRAS